MNIASVAELVGLVAAAIAAAGSIIAVLLFQGRTMQRLDTIEDTQLTIGENDAAMHEYMQDSFDLLAERHIVSGIAISEIQDKLNVERTPDLLKPLQKPPRPKLIRLSASRRLRREN